MSAEREAGVAELFDAEESHLALQERSEVIAQARDAAFGCGQDAYEEGADASRRDARAREFEFEGVYLEDFLCGWDTAELNFKREREL